MNTRTLSPNSRGLCAPSRFGALAPIAHDLAKGSILRARIPAGFSVICDSGAVWITADGQSGDIVIKDRQRQEFLESASIIVEALEDARIRVR